MLDLQALQKRIHENKIKKGFNTTDIFREFCLLHEEVAEASQAYSKKLPDLGEELADVVIYALGISALLGINLEEELQKKVDKNERRQYAHVDGVHVRVTEG